MDSHTGACSIKNDGPAIWLVVLKNDQDHVLHAILYVTLWPNTLHQSLIQCRRNGGNSFLLYQHLLCACENESLPSSRAVKQLYRPYGMRRKTGNRVHRHHSIEQKRERPTYNWPNSKLKVRNEDDKLAIKIEIEIEVLVAWISL